MNYFVCVEDGQVISVVDYQPSVPETVELFPIPAHQYSVIMSGTHYFDCESKEVKPIPQQLMDHQLDFQNKTAFLRSTDWKILRHLREKALGIETSLSEQQYIDLEIERQETAKSIVR